jgi:hypothetical protein
MPIPALPDSERKTTYPITAQTGPFDVGFALYGDGVDYQNWIEVRLDGVLLTPVTEWTLSVPSGTLKSRARPITDARITLGSARTGTLQIYGKLNPRRLVQLAENQGVPAADFNRIVTSLVALIRESWDRFYTTAIRAPRGETPADYELPAAASRANKALGFDATGAISMMDVPAGGGFGGAINPYDLGTISSGTVTPDPANGAQQYYRNAGAHAIAPHASKGSIILDIENITGAGAITDSGFTRRTGDPFTTTVGHKFRCYIDVTQQGSTIHREQLA